MATRSVAVVFGGSGFLGRYVVKRLVASGHVVRVASRDPAAALFLKPMGRVGQVVPLYASLAEAATVARALEGATLAVNLVGILAERRAGDFDRVHAEGAGRLAQAARAAGASRLVHVSAIGADPASPSRYGRSKAAGEVAVRAGFPDATILRPSIVFGPEDQFFNRFAAMSRFAPVMPVIKGDTRFQPVYVGDVAEAVSRALDRQAAMGELYELAGPDVITFRDVMRMILRETGRSRKLLEVPDGLARLQAGFAEKLPGKPFTRDQLAMLGRDNVQDPSRPGLTALDIAPTPMAAVVPRYLATWRKGGGRRDEAGSDL